MASLDTVIERWKREGVDLLPPIDLETVVTALEKTGRRYSRDVVSLYLKIGGMADNSSDSRFWSLWSLDRLASENSRYEPPYILFADFLLDSHCYCFKYKNENTSSVCVEYFIGEEPTQVADSVEHFFQLYLENPGSLEMFDEDDLAPKTAAT